MVFFNEICQTSVATGSFLILGALGVKELFPLFIFSLMGS